MLGAVYPAFHGDIAGMLTPERYSRALQCEIDKWLRATP